MPVNPIDTMVRAHGWLNPACSRPDDSCPPPEGYYHDAVESQGDTQDVLAAHVGGKVAYMKVDEHRPLHPPATICTRGLVYLNSIWSNADADAAEKGPTEQGFVFDSPSGTLRSTYCPNMCLSVPATLGERASLADCAKEAVRSKWTRLKNYEKRSE